MHESQGILGALAMVLGVAAVTTVACHRLRLPVVLGYMVAGLFVGPHVPFPLVADADTVHTLSGLGVILLMFSLGLEFSMRRLAEVAPLAGPTALVHCSLMAWLGVLAGRALGWTEPECLYAGAALAISSTTIVAKAFDDDGVRGPRRAYVLGELIVEDLIAVVLLAGLTAFSSGRGLSAEELVWTLGRLAAFLAALLVAGLLVVPRLVRLVVRQGRSEIMLVAAVGLCFAVAHLARLAGYSEALGAFMAGALVAESGHGRVIGALVHPVRDVFAAVFFVSVGMAIDPALLLAHAPAVAAITLVVLLGKPACVGLGAFFSGRGVRSSIEAGMSLAQIGEFSFIIAALGLETGATREFLFPVLAAVSAVTTLGTPWLIRASGPAARFVDRKLPGPIQTFATLYGSWIERLRAAPPQPGRWAELRGTAGWIAIDAACVAGVVAATGTWGGEAVAWLGRSFGVQHLLARALVVGAAVALCAPFGMGIVRIARHAAALLAAAAFPASAPGEADPGETPRRALVLTLQAGILLLVAAPLLASTQPFLTGPQGAAALGVLAAALAWGVWRSAASIQGNVKAGAQVLAAALAAQSHAKPGDEGAQDLEELRRVLPGLGELHRLRLPEGSVAEGRSLAELNLRGITGATVLALTRGESKLVPPAATERLEAGDLLALAGTREAVEAAAALLEEKAGPIR